MTTTPSEIQTVDLEHVRGGLGPWGQFGINIAQSALQGLSQGGGKGAAEGALGAVKSGLAGLLGGGQG
jgi:hypothetical protein